MELFATPTQMVKHCNTIKKSQQYFGLTNLDGNFTNVKKKEENLEKSEGNYWKINEQWNFDHQLNKALYTAVVSEDLQTVKDLISIGVDVNVTDNHGQSVIFAHNNTNDKLNSDVTCEILTILLNNGASLYVTRSDNVTAMENLLKHGDRKTWLTVIQSQADLSKNCEPNGDTALHFLLENQQLRYDPIEEIELLVRRGFDVNIRNDRSVSPLSIAIKLGYGKSAEYLMRCGVEIKWLEIIENTSIMESFVEHHEQNEKRMFYQKIIEIILKRQDRPIEQDVVRQLQEKFSVHYVNRFYQEIIMAHMVIEEIRDNIPECIVESLMSRYCFRRIYKERIEDLKAMKVDDSVNMYQLLIESDYKINEYVADKDFISALKFIFSQKYRTNLYFLYVIRKRIENALRAREIEKMKGSVLCELIGLDKYNVGENHFVVYKILGYLGKRDVVNMFEDRDVQCENLMPTKDEVVPENFVSKMMKFFHKRRCF